MPEVRKDFTKNLDAHLARQIDDALTYYNLHHKNHGDVDTGANEHDVIFIRDAFRHYWMSIEAEWEGYTVEEDIETVQKELREAMKLLGEIWPDLWW